tara:strand:- start:325 stop:537 length:213 start_codon:yes stop_codon:yes gene_type:complete
MNKDHISSVHRYLNLYSNIYEFKEAKMIEIQSKYMKIMYDNEIATIEFREEISEEEIHGTLVTMAKATNS